MKKNPSKTFFLLGKVIFAFLLIALWVNPLIVSGEIVFFDEGEETAIGQEEATNESLSIDEEEGFWQYNSPNLTVVIHRFYEQGENITWYLAEIKAQEGEYFHCIASTDDENQWPTNIAQENNTVFAINSDFHHLRMAQKGKTGVLVRNSEIIGEKTYGHNKGSFPNLDTMALYPDGRLEVYPSDAYTGQEYLDMGAVDVLAFGPYLIKDGQLNQAALDKYGKSSAPRTAIGMVAPGHYFAIMVEGRHSKSDGASVSFAAQKLYDQGCVAAFNLDGGQTATMLFMGEQIIKIGLTDGENASARRCTEIVGIGTSQLVTPK